MTIYDHLEGMEEILGDFIVETKEMIDQLDQDLLSLESQTQDQEVVNRVFRAFHTIKGTSGFLNLDAFTTVAHAAEDILNKIRMAELQPTSQVVDVIFETVDWFKQAILIVEGHEENFPPVEPILGKISEVQGQDPDADSNPNPESESETSDETDYDALFAAAKTGNREPKKIPEGTDEILDLATVPDELVNEYITEAIEILDAISGSLMNLESSITPDEPFTMPEDVINDLFRAFHTLKGNSSLLGFSPISRVAHKAEDYMGLLKEGLGKPAPVMIDTFLLVADWILALITDLQQGEPKPHKSGEVIHRLDELINQCKNTTIVDSTTVQANGAKPVSNRKTKSEQAVPGKPNDSRAQKPSEAASLQISGGTPTVEKTIRVDVEKLDRLIDLAGELVLEKNRLNQVSNEIQTLLEKDKRNSELGTVNNSLRHLTKDIQEGVMQLRMLPIAHAFKRFPRLVRDLTRSGQKKIDLTITGEDTHLDRSVIEAIGDPLVHLVRNAIDHGIETVAERLQKGKTENGHLQLGAHQQGNQIIIEIKDDGAGINVEKVLAKAISRELISQEEADRMSEQDAKRLIFSPGLSTAAKVTDISGRGVGMDVVANNISKLNGSIDVRSTVGQGTTFTIKLPLTLTITSGMVVRVGSERYILPQISVAESIRVTPGMLDSIQGHHVLRLRDSVIPIIHMSRLLDVPEPSEDESNKDPQRGEEFIVIVNNADKSVGLVVSELVGIEETLVKSMGNVLGKVPFIAGATIRGDGHVVLILDVGDLVNNGINNFGRAA
ncbi:MAG: chemotaxis protein CheA [Candidatus Marinimicrobia bacterium]|nr:chemotaxis protein CheA [Candidatus Neomarinimicrobiota bacterium]MCF7841065.1 chemotaxis protein CheA [Candidatus Neomarinimicrobiota bacterium]